MRIAIQRRIKGSRVSNERNKWKTWKARLGLLGQMSKERDRVVAAGMVGPLLCLQ